MTFGETEIKVSIKTPSSPIHAGMEFVDTKPFRHDLRPLQPVVESILLSGERVGHQHGRVRQGRC